MSLRARHYEVQQWLTGKHSGGNGAFGPRTGVVGVFIILHFCGRRSECISGGGGMAVVYLWWGCFVCIAHIR